jgi:threonine aldolase
VSDTAGQKPARDREAIRARCTRFLSRQKPPSPKEVLQALADDAGAGEIADMYGKGRIIEAFERELATLLGKETAVFMPSGTMAQAVALRVWCEKSGSRTVGLHPLSHLERNESQAYRLLHGLSAHYLGDDSRQFRRSDLDALVEPLGALVLEMPLRPLAYLLLPWEELEAISAFARERRIRLHLDGARLWESQPYYGRSLAEIASLFDSVYVSFYKGLGGIAGAALAGSKDFIDACRLWQHRQGGRLVQLFPLVISARKGMAERLPLMGRFHETARGVAEALRGLDGLRITPDPPHTTAFHIVLPAERDRAEAAVLDMAEATGIWLVDRTVPLPIQGLCQAELTVGTGTLDFSRSEIRGLFEELLRRLG